MRGAPQTVGVVPVHQIGAVAVGPRDVKGAGGRVVQAETLRERDEVRGAAEVVRVAEVDLTDARHVGLGEVHAVGHAGRHPVVTAEELEHPSLPLVGHAEAAGGVAAEADGVRPLLQLVERITTVGRSCQEQVPHLLADALLRVGVRLLDERVEAGGDAVAGGELTRVHPAFGIVALGVDLHEPERVRRVRDDDDRLVVVRRPVVVVAHEHRAVGGGFLACHHVHALLVRRVGGRGRCGGRRVRGAGVPRDGGARDGRHDEQQDQEQDERSAYERSHAGTSPSCSGHRPPPKAVTSQATVRLSDSP